MELMGSAPSTTKVLIQPNSANFNIAVAQM